MMFLFCIMAVLFGFPPGEAFVLHPSQGEPAGAPTSISHMPVVKVNRCQGESLQVIKQKLLAALNLDKEPQVSRTGLSRLREQWKAALGATAHSPPKPQEVTVVNTTLESPGNQDDTNNMSLRCCQLVSQMFIQDLGWEDWIIYPDTFTYTQCTVCNPHLDPTAPQCREHQTTRPQNKAMCCQPTSEELVPFFYMDELNTPVISTVALTRQCGCKPTSDQHDAQN